MSITKWKRNGLILAIILLFSSVFLSQKSYANASTLHISAEYDAHTLSSAMEVKLSVTSSSDLVMLKYAYARVGLSRYFTLHEENGYSINKNEDGVYSFHVTQNGYVSVFAQNAAGEEYLLKFNVKNIDTEAPEISVTTEEYSDMFFVNVLAKDDRSDSVSIQYTEGAYGSVSDSVWRTSQSFQNERTLYLKPGKYSFLAKDSAGNAQIYIYKFGEENVSEEEFRAVWISYLDFKTTGYTKDEFQTKIQTMFDDVKRMKMNAVVVHVRPFGDAFYPSEYFPWSRYVSGKQGKNPGFDPLGIMINEAHERGLEFHAWLNPYRITSSSTNVYDLSADNPARIYRTDKKTSNDRNVLSFGGKLYYNPSVKEVQTLIVDGIKEIVTNYDVDGIHFDDYFYPMLGKNFTSNFDAKEYNSYKNKKLSLNSTYMSIMDWRRDNVNTLIRTIYSAVKEINPDVVFGVSPGGFMDALKADDKYYVDFETWLSHDGYIDYLCPQLYWSNDHSIYPFNNILDRFIKAVKNPDVKLYIGVGAYKAGIKSEGTAWYKNAFVLRDMIRYARETNNVDGYILYSYKDIIAKRSHSAIINLLREFR